MLLRVFVSIIPRYWQPCSCRCGARQRRNEVQCPVSRRSVSLEGRRLMLSVGWILEHPQYLVHAIRGDQRYLKVFKLYTDKSCADVDRSVRWLISILRPLICL
ncbi:hypothetical protein E2C01_022083 [Portunus trituberculatus]|uniref:Uncharacterized protein n=1 Tax=Portunus trituberculatus TaxID=210409 RepID=A0A5B7E4G9_PORTR|nr:hypothetical protein [Portunus trituberculatus]